MQPDVPQRPPLEIIKQGSLWVVEDYRQGARTGKSHATLDSQMSALRYAKSKMEADRHPCILRWDSPRSVGGLYWNPLFDCLTVRPDELVSGWTVVPEKGTCAMAGAPSRADAADRAKKIQRVYDFKHLRVYDGRDEEYEERDHRFLRNEITRSGVRFNRDAVTSTPEPEDDDPEPAPDNAEVDMVGPASPGQLGASVPDVTQVEFTDTDGAVHLYSTPWNGGTQAQIITVSRKYATDEGVPEAFAGAFERWQASQESPHVATVYESGTDPTSWVAYQVGNHTLAEIGTDLPARSRMEIIGQIADAIGTVTGESGHTCGIYPANVHLLEADGGRRATVANWGIEWAVREAIGMAHGGPFLAPEQLDGRLTAATPVYQLGAVAYWLLCETPPPDAPSPDAGSIPEPTGEIDPGISAVLARALAADPSDRYDDAETFYRALVDFA